MFFIMYKKRPVSWNGLKKLKHTGDQWQATLTQNTLYQTIAAIVTIVANKF